MNPILARMYASLAQDTTTKQGKTARDVYDAYLQQTYGKFCEPIKGVPDFKSDHMKKQFMVALDNIVAMSYMEGSNPNSTTGTGTTPANLGIPHIIPPILRRVMPTLFIQDIVSVQSIPLPEAKIFFYVARKINVVNAASAPIGEKANFNRIFANSTELPATVNRVTFDLTSTSISTGSKKLAAEWSIELEQDLAAYLQMSAESELVYAKSEEIRLELESDVLNTLLGDVTENVNWNSTAPAGDVTTADKKAYAETLFEAFVTADYKVYNKRFVHTTWIVASSDVCERIAKLQKFVPNEGMSLSDFAVARQFVGVLANRWRVYNDPFFMPAGKCLMGYNNPNNTLHTGFVFAPYIPVYLTDTVESATGFKKAKGFMSRNGMKTVIPEMYVTVTILA